MGGRAAAASHDDATATRAARETAPARDTEQHLRKRAARNTRAHTQRLG
jgi:hypothetical protein